MASVPRKQTIDMKLLLPKRTDIAFTFFIIMRIVSFEIGAGVYN
jgi:hypothetical protein